MVKNSVLHDFGFGKVSQIHETFLIELQLFGWRHFSKACKIEVGLRNNFRLAGWDLGSLCVQAYISHDIVELSVSLSRV